MEETGMILYSLKNQLFASDESSIYSRLGYNHAHECRPVTMEDVNKVKSNKNSPFILELAKL